MTGADWLIEHAKIYTMNPRRPEADAIAIRGNEIVYVGDSHGARAFVDAHTRRLDFTGKTLMPGFISAHDHLIASNWAFMGVHVFAAQDRGDCLRRIAEYARAHPEEEYIRGVGWNVETYGGLPTAEELDTVVPDRPAFILDFTIHDAWLNSRALQAGGITKDTPDPQPGVTFWRRDSDGNPTGVGVEGAWMSPYVVSGAWEAEKMMRASTEKLFALASQSGVTTIQNPGLVTPNVLDAEGVKSDFRIALEMLATLEAAGELPLRVFAMQMFKSTGLDPEDFARFSAEMGERYNSDRLRVSAVKIHPEGNWTSHVAAMLEPYEDRDTKGRFGVTPERIKAMMLAANAQGLDVVTHVDGSATVRAVVDAIEASRQAGYHDARNSLHHLLWTHPADYRRIVEMRIPVNITPMFSLDWSNQDTMAYQMLGEKRVRQESTRYPDLAREGISVTLSADVPSTPPEYIAPLFSVEAAITLQDPSNPDSKPFPPRREPMTIDQALRSITVEAAWQLRMEDKLGSLEVGKYADLVVLEQDPYETPLRDIADIRVLATMMDGKFQHQAGIPAL